MGSIVLLSGPVGAGKSTIARELLAITSGPATVIEGDQFWRFIDIAKGADGPVKTFRTLMASILAAAIPFSMAGYEVIVDFSIPPWFLDRARESVALRRQELHYAVLLPNETVCEARASQRVEGKVSEYARYRDLYQDFLASPTPPLDADLGTPGEIAQRLRAKLDGGEFRLV